jgi:hypothetical protein
MEGWSEVRRYVIKRQSRSIRAVDDSLYYILVNVGMLDITTTVNGEISDSDVTLVTVFPASVL